MRNTWSVEIYGQWFGAREYSFLQVWQGKSFIKALWAMRKYRQDGTGCIKLEWRPRRK